MSTGTFYVGTRFVLNPQEGDPTNTYTGRKATYSNWALFSRTHVLDGAPDNAHTPGTGYSPGDIHMSRVYRGLEDAVQPLKAAGLGPRQDAYYFRQQPLLWKGVTAAGVFSGTDFGHVEGGGPLAEYATNQINLRYLGVPSGEALPRATTGHAQRYWEQAGVPSGFGAIRPYEYQGVPGALIPDTGHPEYAPSVIADATFDYGKVAPDQGVAHAHYGFEHVLEHQGVPSSKALGVVSNPGPPKPINY